MVKLIILLVIILLILYTFYKIFKKIVKAILLLLFLIIIVSIILGISLFKDYQELKTNIQTSPTIVFFTSNNTIKTGFIITPNTKNQTTTPYTPLTDQEVIIYQQYLSQKDYNGILSNNYKLFIINTIALQKLLKDKIEIIGKEVTKEQIIGLIDSDNLELFIQKQNILNLEQIKKELNIKNNIQLKAAVLIISLKEDNLPLLLEEFKMKNIIIYPETILFKTIRVIP